MIETTKCRNCGQAYELIWNDVDIDDWRDDFEDDYNATSDEDDENADPVYCPFCGTHMDFDD